MKFQHFLANRDVMVSDGRLPGELTAFIPLFSREMASGEAGSLIFPTIIYSTITVILK